MKTLMLALSFISVLKIAAQINGADQLKKPIYAIFLSWALLFSSWSVAADVQTNQELKQYISASMNHLVVKLKTHKFEYKQDYDLFYNDLNVELSKVIDFKRIALKVMGKFGRSASKEQRTQFIKVFKRSLYKTYAQILLDSKDVEIIVVNAALNTRNPKKAKVDMEIKAAGGSSYAVSYALNKGKDQAYRVENIIIMGINMGLAFKDRFQQQVKAYKGNINSVIENWSVDETA